MPARTVSGRGRWSAAAERMEELRAVLPSLTGLPIPGPETAPEVIVRLADALESLRRARIRDQIRFAGLQEFTESLLRVRDAAHVLEMLVRYLRQVFGLEEILLLRRLPRSGSWVGFHHARGQVAPLRLDRFPWRAEWAEPLLRAAPGGDDAATLPREDPRRYQSVLPLDGRGVEEGADIGVRPHGADDEGPIGVLALTPSTADVAEREWKPIEMARTVESILEILWHREEMEAAASLRRQLLEAMEDGLIAFDRAGEVLASNAAAARLLGLDAARNGPVSTDDLQGSAPALLQHVRAALARGEEPPPREFALGPRDAPAPVRAAVSGLRDEAGSTQGLVVNLTDLSGIRSMEDEIRRLDRLAAIGRFAAGVAHEIRNPLGVIAAGVEFHSGRLGDGPADREDLRILRSEIARLDRIVTDLLDYTRPRPLSPSPVACRELSARVTLALGPLVEAKRIAWRTSGPETLMVWADPDRAAQVLINLAKNALEASAEGGRVDFWWEPGSAATVAGETDGVVFHVRDQGPGLSAEQEARAFEPFFTTKNGGSGLGLALCHALVEQHQGKLLLTSAPGEGTTATAEFPPAGAETERSDASVHSDRR